VFRSPRPYIPLFSFQVFLHYFISHRVVIQCDDFYSCVIQIIKMNYLNYTDAQCAGSTPEQPPTTSAWCAMSIGSISNLSSALQYCCNGTPVATYNVLNGPYNCWQYCNTTTFENQTLFDCLDKFPGIGGHISACGPDKSKKSHAVTHGASSKLVLATLGILVARLVVGADMWF
jgi:hypothetical protein